MMYKSEGYKKSAKFYDMFDTKKNIEFFKSYALKNQDTLDVGAGTGRIAIPIAKEGIKVFCIEPSLEMINEFLRKIHGKKQIAKYLEIFNSDASSFRFDRKFNFIFMSGVFDHLLSDKERLLVLENIRNHLGENGIFVFDVFVGLMKDSPLKPAGIFEEEGKSYKRFVKSQLKEEGLMEVTLRYETYINGELVEIIEELSLVSTISKEHLIDLLKSSNFKVKALFGDYRRKPFIEGDELLIIETRIDE